MALLFHDGFDGYATADIGQKWIGGTTGQFIIQSGGRNGGQRLRITSAGHVRQIIQNTQTVIVGFAWQSDGPDDGGNDNIVVFRDAGTVQTILCTAPNNGFRVLRGGTEISKSGTALYPLNAWQYVEIQITTASGTGGSYIVWLNGVQVLNTSGVNTQVTANAFVNQIELSCNNLGLTNSFDDFYILDTTGIKNNAALGDITVVNLMPVSDGSNAGWIPDSGGAHFSRVNEVPENGDTSYVSSSTPGAIDSYHFQPVIVTGRIIAVQTTTVCRKDDAGARAIQNYALSGGTVHLGAIESVTSSYQYFLDVMESDPNTGADWTQNGLNAAEFGISLQS